MRRALSRSHRCCVADAPAELIEPSTKTVENGVKKPPDVCASVRMWATGLTGPSRRAGARAMGLWGVHGKCRGESSRLRLRAGWCPRRSPSADQAIHGCLRIDVRACGSVSYFRQRSAEVAGMSLSKPTPAATKASDPREMHRLDLAAPRLVVHVGRVKHRVTPTSR